MKRAFAWVLPILLLTACTAASGLELMEMRNDPLPEETPAEETVSYAVHMVTWEDAVQAEDGTVLASSSIQVPKLTARRADGTAVTEAKTEKEQTAASVAETFNRKFEDWAAAGEFQQVSGEARERWDAAHAPDAPPEWAGEWIGEYTLELTSSVYQTDHMLSVAGNYYSFTGGAHGNTTLMAWNYDLTTGSFFGPEFLAEDGQAFSRAVQEEIVLQCQTMAAEENLRAEDLFWSNYAEIAAGWSSYAVSFDEEGMAVGFSPYELACYAAGPQVFHLSYDWLRPYLSQHGLEVLGLA